MSSATTEPEVDPPGDGVFVELRREPFEFGALPASALAPTVDAPAALVPLQRRFLAAAVPVGGRPAVAAEDVAQCLDLSRDAASVVIATLRATLPTEAEADMGDLVFVQDLMLFLFVQTFARPRAQSQLRESGGVLETAAGFAGDGRDDGDASGAERERLAGDAAFGFGSPARRRARTAAAKLSPKRRGAGSETGAVFDSDVDERRRPSLHALFAAYHFNAACGLVVEDPAKIDTGGPGGGRTEMTAAEADRLGYLFRVIDANEETGGETGGAGTAPGSGSGLPEIPGALGSISRRSGLFAGGDRATVPAAALREWLVSRLAGARFFGKSKSASFSRLAGAPSSPGRASSPGGSPASPASPGTLSSYLPCSTLHASAMIENVRKGTAVRRRRDFPRDASARVADCEDAVVYLLAPAAYVSVVGCVDCVVVIGAASRAVRVERCRRVTVIAATRRLRVRAARECAFHLAVAEKPVFLGECRGNVVAPYNTFYETLEADLRTAGLRVEDLSSNWNDPQCAFADVSVADAASDEKEDDEGSKRRALVVKAEAPEAFAPFIVPFREPLVSGATHDSRDEFGGEKVTRANPFSVPDAYVAALDAKVRAVASLRGALRDARLDERAKRELQAVVQAHFKEWLLASGAMRQVYELARIERGESAL